MLCSGMKFLTEVMSAQVKKIFGGKIVKKFLVLLATIFIFSANFVEAGHLEEIAERGTIKIGTTGDYKPMSYFNKETGEYEGIDAELSKIIAESLGVKILLKRLSRRKKRSISFLRL